VKVRVTLDVSEEVARRLAVLVGSTEETLEHRVADVLMELADHAQQGVYRPGSWERPWLVQAFGDYFLERVETDPNAPMFDRVKS
jgi:hypothetical protein